MNSIKLVSLKLLLHNQLPLVGGWLCRQAIEMLAEDGSPPAIRLLAETVADSDNNQRQNWILAVLRQLTIQASVNAVCQVWAMTRHPLLANLLAERGWTATAPVVLKVLTALHAGQLDKIVGGGAEIVEPLVLAAGDAAPAIAGKAGQALRQLQRKAAQEALCRLVIEQDQPAAREAALAAGYAPQDQTQRALFFFLTGQWARYDNLDFDRRLLRVVYQSASPALRQRLLEQMRRAGRTEFLPIITGGDYRARLAEMGAGEFDLLVQTLAANQEWAELWGLAFDAPFRWSVQIIKTLAGQTWRPPLAEEQPIFDRLATLAGPELPSDEAGLKYLFPPALCQAEARVPGRINDITFAPGRPVIALGTGQRKVVLWNFQRAEREHLLNKFDHSIGQVVFSPHNLLLCAERTNSGGPCAIYSWDESNLRRLGEHRDAVTALAPVGETHLLSAGRDRQVILWDTATQRPVKQHRFGFWARMVRVSPGGREAVLLHQGFELVTLPDLRVTERGQGRASVARCAVYTPDEQTLLVGQFNGEVIIFKRSNSGPFKRQRDPLRRSQGRVVGLEVLPRQEVIISAASEGIIEFRQLGDMADLGRVRAPGGDITSLHVSADESFMAVGSAQAALSLWDLRALVIPGLLARPLAQATPTQLSTVTLFSQNPHLSPPARQVLEFTAAILQHRLRYAIELEETPEIKLGEFDIEIE